MAFEVRVTADALRDLEEIEDWITANDGPTKAANVAEKLEAAIESLKRFPDRGRHPPELLLLGIREYRETFFKPYRILYHLEDKTVFVILVADGRRDMQTLLETRLLGA